LRDVVVELPESARNRALFALTERGQQGALSVNEVGECRVDRVDPFRGQGDDNAPSVIWISGAGNESSGLKLRQAVGECARTHQRLVEEVLRAHPVGLASTAKGCQNIELKGLQARGAKRFSAEVLHVFGNPGDAGKDFQRRHIEIGAFSTPRVDNAIDIISRNTHPTIIGPLAD
jgi:hypothetical protein